MGKENILANIRKKGFALNVQLNRDDIILENHLRFNKKYRKWFDYVGVVPFLSFVQEEILSDRILVLFSV